jgi:hypothetical protein
LPSRLAGAPRRRKFGDLIFSCFAFKLTVFVVQNARVFPEIPTKSLNFLKKSFEGRKAFLHLCASLQNLRPIEHIPNRENQRRTTFKLSLFPLSSAGMIR